MTFPRHLPFLLNLAAGLAALVTLTVWPPAYGALLLLPLRTLPAGLPERAAIAGGAALIARGPLPGSVIVMGDRARIATRVARAGILILAAPPAGCTAARDRGARA